MDFFIAKVPDAIRLGQAYSPWLVALSFLVATVGSALAFYVADTASATSNPRSKDILMLAGAVAFGLAVWTMHFIGMLALSLCTSVNYDMVLTSLSALPGIASAWVMLHWLTRKDLNRWQVLLGGAITGAGIGLMHYSGMMAMRMSASLRFDPLDFAISIIAAVVLASVALGARNGLLANTRVRPFQVNALSVLIMGLAITTMHYMGMAAARFIGQPETATPVPTSNWMVLASFIIMAIISMLGFTAAGVLLTRLRDSLAEIKVQRQELEAIIQSSTEAIVISDAKGVIKETNKAFQRIFDCDASDAAGKNISSFLPQWPNLLRKDQPHTPHESNGQRRSNEAFPVSVAYTRLVIDALTVYVGFITDLSDVKRAQEKLQHDATHDFLTGLNNRRYFDDQLKLELERSHRSGQPLSLLLLDIDRFKRINDDHGHMVGDRALEVLALEMRRHARAGDVVSRFGGEEFVLLMPNTSQASARTMAERLRGAAEKIRVKHDGKVLRFTVSIGVSSGGNTEDSTQDVLLASADKALYAAKEGGRNRVEVFGGEPEPKLAA